MLLYFLLAFFNKRNGARATPITHYLALPHQFTAPQALDDQASLSLLESCLCKDTRTIWDIVWGCLATIFACSWVSIHPNIPDPNEGNIRRAIRRIELMLWALISPELIIFWALNQWTSARAIEERYKDRGWTKVHGYFIQMGGFMLYEGDTPKGVLFLPTLEELLEQNKIDFPSIAEEDIKDRSKGDGLSKAVVLIQTTWFIIQCIARHTQNLDITQLELLTAALAILNGAMYMFWWNKPLSIGRAVPVRIKPSPEWPEKQFADVAIQSGEGSSDPITCDEVLHVHDETTKEEPTSSSLFPDAFDSTKVDERACNAIETRVNQTEDNSGSIHHSSNAEKASIEQPHHGQVETTNRPLYRRKRLKRVPFFDLVPAFARPIMRVIIVPMVYLNDELAGARFTPEDGEMRVPTFHASKFRYSHSLLTFNWTQFGFAIVIAVAFGGIHCVGWFFSFPSSKERTIWRISSVVITTFPGFLMLATIIILPIIVTVRKKASLELRQRLDGILGAIFFGNKIVEFIFFMLMIWLPWVYVTARVCLLIVALTSLRNLPEGAYDVVQWTTFIPHI